ncbi:MAG TPA: hypothetical protein VK610_02405 [Rhodothermales bacterium]|nr:hypothetical protein [Rhodothermales bacterium]
MTVHALRAAFEAGTLPLEAFDHRAHMAMGLAYLDESASLEEATEKMRAGLRGFLAAHGKAEGYHETVTVFWMRLLDHLARTRYAHLDLDARAAAIADDWAPRRPLQAHFSPERLGGEAREAWVEPDLQPLPF